MTPRAAITTPRQRKRAPATRLPVAALTPAAFEIPKTDLREFSEEGTDCQAEVTLWLKAFDAVLHSARGKARQLATNRAVSRLGCSQSTFENKLSAWRVNGHNWRVLIDRRRHLPLLPQPPQP